MAERKTIKIEPANLVSVSSINELVRTFSFGQEVEFDMSEFKFLDPNQESVMLMGLSTVTTKNASVIFTNLEPDVERSLRRLPVTSEANFEPKSDS